MRLAGSFVCVREIQVVESDIPVVMLCPGADPGFLEWGFKVNNRGSFSPYMKMK